MEHSDMSEALPVPHYIGFGMRLVASLVDTIILAAISLPLILTMYGSDYFDTSNQYYGVVDVIISYIFPFVATVLFWVYKSATPGKMVVNAKVVDLVTGNPPSFKQSVVRYIGYYVSVIPLFLGFLWIFWDKRKQGWHDKLAGTVVIYPPAQ